MTRTAISAIVPAFLFVIALLALASADAPGSQASGSLGVIAPSPTPSPIVCPLFTPAPSPSPSPPAPVVKTFCAPSRQQATQLHVRVHTGGAALSASVQENAAGCPDPTITISDEGGFKVALVDWQNTHCVSPGEFVVMQFSSSATPTVICWHWISFGQPFPGPESCLSRTGMDRMNIDVEEEATPANSSSSLGSVEGCRRIDENDLLDADEDVADGLLIDITADGVASFNNGGTPADTFDDIGGVIGYTYELSYLASALTVQEQTVESQPVNMLARNAGSAIFNASDSVPDDNADNVWNSAALDTSVTEPEGDNGVLDRLTIVSETGSATGNYSLRQSNNAHFDVTGTAYEPEITNNAVVAVNEACGASVPINPPTSSPPPTTPVPTPIPTPPSEFPMQAMSIDMDEEASPANTSASLGSREDCARINENDTLDADEDVVDGLLIDTTAAGIPPYDGSIGGGIIAYAYYLNYPAASLTVQAQLADDPLINILFTDADSHLNASEPLPDDNLDDAWNSSVIDHGNSTPESGDGVLDRLTLVSDAGAAAGNFYLYLSSNAHLDASGTAYFPLVTNNAVVAVNEACGASPVITPPPTPTPEPTPTPGPPTPTPSPAPVICPAPTASPTPSPLPGTPGPSTNFMSFCNRNQQAASDLHIRISNVDTSAQLQQNAPGCPEPTITTTTGSPTVDVVWPVACVDQGESVTLAVTCQAPCFIIFIQCYDWTRFGTVLPSSPTPCPAPTAPPPTSSATPRPELPMQAMSIDMNEEATPANTSTSLGSLEQCARINENNILDADEDSTDGVDIDVTALGIPPYDDGGTSDPSDDTGGIIGYAYDLGYNEVSLTVAAVIYNDAAVNIMSANAGSLILNVSDVVPDTNSDNVWIAAAIDNGAPSTPESGSGVLDRLTLTSDAGGMTGTYPLTLDNNIHLDASGAAFFPLITNGALVAINSTCAFGSPPLPSGTSTPTPLPTPTPFPGTSTPSPTASSSPSPSPSSTPGPTPSPSPTATPAIDIRVWTFVNETGQAASDLHAFNNGPIIPSLEENAPGCPAPTLTWQTSTTKFELDWGTACVDPGETVRVRIVSEPPSLRTCYHWTISGTPIEPSCLTPTPTPTPLPTRTPTPTPPACILDDDDFDNDGQNNSRDRDDDNDGIRDSNDRDDDNDGVRDSRDPDDDNDGIPDRADRDDGRVYCG